ncbi:MAG: glycosyltransferase family 4 protein [Fimbriimonadales bacterium]|nr:glycosyltransferase family 4 protein [Fimbriimonadales bacterium]
MSKCLRVWFVNPYALPPDEAGTTRHYGLSSYLIQRGHQALVIASPVHYLTRRRLAGRSGIQAIQGVPFAWIDAPTYRDNGLSRLRNSLVFTLRLLRLPLAQMPFLPDVIVGSSPHPFGAWAAERIARRLRVPFLFEIRDLWPQSLIDLRTVSPHHPVVPVLRSLERTLCHRAQRVIVLPSRVGEYLKRYGVAPSKVVWLPNFIKLDLAPPPTPPPSSEVFEVMYTGTIGVANGVEFLIEAFALLEGTGSKVRLRVVGDGIQREALQQEVQRLGLRSVLFTPPVSKAELLTQMVHAHAFGFVSKEAALFQWGMSPNKLYDYMALARPVIFAGHIPDNPVESAGCGIVTKVEAASIAGAVQKIAAMTIEERYAMGLRGRCYVEQHYSDTVVGQRLEQLLAEVASCPSTQVNLSVTGGSE